MKKILQKGFAGLLMAVMMLQIIAAPIMAAKETSGEELLPSISITPPDGGQVSGLDLNKYLNGYTAEMLGAYRPDDEVTAIVKLQGDSILTLAQRAGLSAAEYVKTDAGKAAIEKMTQEQDRMIRDLGTKISDVKHRYTTIFSGFSCKTTYETLSTIENAYAGARAMISERYEPAQTVATDNALNAYGTGIYNSSEAGYTGKGMVVAVLDTGLDYNHTAFQRLPEGQLKLTKDDIQELYPSLMAAGLNESTRYEECYYSDKVIYMYDYADKDPDVYTINDHGTHVAGIITGKDDVITGVAIDAQLVVMKVFGNEDKGAETEDLLAALSDCIMLGVDVINMSLGSSCGFSRAADDEGVNEVYDAVRAAGINLIVAASNSHSSAKGSNVGDTNRTTNPDSATLGSPSTYDSSMSVASVLGAKTHYLLANGTMPIYLTKAKNNHGDDIEFYDLLLDGSATKDFEYVLVPGVGYPDNYETVDVRGKIAIIQRGVSTFEEKVQVAEANGAIGAIIYNNVSGVISMTIGTATLPTCSISMDAGVYFVENPTGTITLNVENLAGPFMSDFSSWGPNSDLILNPDVTSYGGDINSAVRGGYDILSGTSMACPNLAGSALLVREHVKTVYPHLTADEMTAMVDRLLMSTASVLRNEAGNPYSPRKQGAGLADAERAIKTGAYLMVDGSDKAKLSLGDDPQKSGVYTLTFRLCNLSASTLSYDLSTLVMTETVSSDGKTVAEQATMLTAPTTYAAEGGALNGTVVTVQGYSDVLITATVTLTEEDKAYIDRCFANGMYVEGFVLLRSLNGDCDLTLPYLAFYGDWTVAPLLDVTAFEEGKEAKNPAILDDEKLKADVFATLPMVGFYSGKEITYYYMAKPAFILADGYEAPPTLEEYCALTTNINGNFQLKYINAGLLRNAKEVYMTITDSLTGEVIFTKTEQNCRKSHYSGQQTGGYVEVEFDASTANLNNNRKYTFTMECKLDWEGEQNNLNNKFSFDFYIDDEAPVVDYDQTVLRVTKNKSGAITGYNLDLYVYDNRYLSGFFLATFDALDENGNPIEEENVIDGFIPLDDLQGATTNKVTIGLTHVWHKLVSADGNPDVKNLQLVLYDYAKNRTVVNLTLDKSAAETVNFKNGKKTTEKGDEISFTLAPNKQLNLLSTDYLVTTPQDVYTEDLLWETSDPTIAIVKDGVVTALATGECTITATSPTTGAHASVSIKCTGKPASDKLPVTGITLNTTALSLERGESYDLYATVAPYNVAEIPEVTWAVSSPYVKLIPDPDDPLHCTVFALKPGGTSVSVKAVGTLFSAACSVSVKQEFKLTGALLESYTGRGDENGVVEIPADKGITYINRLAFFDNDYITKVIIPEGVEEIQYAAFYGCENLKEIVLPKSCKTIGEWAFGYNEKLETINLENVQSIYQLAFYANKALKEADLSGCHTVCDRAFSFCSSLKRVDISNVGQIGLYSFVNCTSLEELVTSEINKIENYAFMGCSSLRSLELYANYVGEYAFYSCSALTDLTFMSDVLEVDRCAFYNATALTNLSFRGKCKYINDLAFANCFSLTAIMIPAGCEYIGMYAFGAARQAEIISFSADANIRAFGAHPFYYVTKVQEFTVEPGSKYLTVNNGILYDKNMTKLLLAPFAAEMSYVSVPSSVSAIGDYAFSCTPRLTAVMLNNVKTIGEGAFADSSLRTVNGTDGLVAIGDLAFAGCAGLESFKIPQTLTTIGEGAFNSCENLAWGNLTIPSNVTSIGDMAFAGNLGLTAVTIPASVNTVADGVFQSCSALTSVTIADGITGIGEYCFALSGITAIDVPDSVTELGAGVFAYCEQLADVDLSESIEQIPDYAFFGATALTALSIPDSVKTIGAFAFRGTSALTSIDLAKVETVGEYAFIGSALNTLVADEVLTIGSYAFRDAKLQTIALPKATEIGAYAFYNASELTSVEANEALTVGTAAFYLAKKLNSVALNKCETLGDAAFYGASALTSVDLPCVKSIGSYAFYQTKIDAIALPETLLSVAPNAFTTKLHMSEEGEGVWFDGFTLSDRNETFFLDDAGVLYAYITDSTYMLVAYPSGKTEREYTVLDGTVRIADYAFYENRSIEKVTVARTVKNIGASAFAGCGSLKTVQFLSVAAPTLESKYAYSSADGWTYHNFVSKMDKDATNAGVEVVVPKNAAGYDSYLWKHYVGETISSNVNSMTDSTAYLIERIDALPDEITLANAQDIDYLQKVYGATDAVQRSFVTNYAKLEAAIQRIATLRAEDPEEGDDDGAGQTPPPTAPDPAPAEKNDASWVWILVCVVLGGGIGAAAYFAVRFIKKKGGNSDEK